MRISQRTFLVQAHDLAQRSESAMIADELTKRAHRGNLCQMRKFLRYAKWFPWLCISARMGSPEKMPADDFPDEEQEDERSPDGFDYEAVLKESFDSQIPIQAYVGCGIKFFRPSEYELNDECHQSRNCC